MPEQKQYFAGLPVWGECRNCHLCWGANTLFRFPQNISVANRALDEVLCICGE
jgi:hypothetical protein